MNVLKLPQIGKPALLAMAVVELCGDSFPAWLLAHIVLMKRETGGNWNPTPNSLEFIQHKQKERAQHALFESQILHWTKRTAHGD